MNMHVAMLALSRGGGNGGRREEGGVGVGVCGQSISRTLIHQHIIFALLKMKPFPAVSFVSCC